MSTGAPAPKKPVPPPAAVGNAPASDKKEKKAKKEKVTKNVYPGCFDKDGNIVKLTTVPTDYNPKAHAPLKKKDFADEPTYLEFVASQFDLKAKSLREEADKIRKLGKTAGNAKVKTLLKMQSRMAELMEALKAEGFDMSELEKS